jgi:hypothetical protein
MSTFNLNKGDQVIVNYTFNSGSGSGSSGNAEIKGEIYKVEDQSIKVRYTDWRGKKQRVEIGLKAINKLTHLMSK